MSAREQGAATKRRRRVSFSHVVWAYDEIIKQYAQDGLTPTAIRNKLREEHDLHVGVDAVKDVLA